MIYLQVTQFNCGDEMGGKLVRVALVLLYFDIVLIKVMRSRNINIYQSFRSSWMLTMVYDGYWNPQKVSLLNKFNRQK